MAHCWPTARHFGQAKMLDTLRKRIDCPHIAIDVYALCTSCPTCQQAASASTQRAHLHSLPVMEVPFKRIAMDIFGPLKRITLENNTFS